ncbi:MAG TPA: prepilin-type N-terminal cleavage/methylation domain-containing protein [Methylomirabilota bacterium]|nr:prepilin-type N-terminal cleavage/methylation domain-containing protein [Methylomirabilota bacterium]
MGTTRALVLGEGGFTLTELLVTLAIVGLVVGGLATMIVTGQQHYVMGANQVEAQQNVRIAFDRLAREIREAGYNPTRNANWAAVVNVAGGAAMPTATAFMIQNDWNGDGAANPLAVCIPSNSAPPACAPGDTLRGEQVRYAIVGTQLTRQEIGIDAAAQVLIAGVDTTGIAQPFDYRAFDGVTVPGAPANIAQVTVTLQAVSESNLGASATSGHVVVRMNDTVRLRNK